MLDRKENTDGVPQLSDLKVFLMVSWLQKKKKLKVDDNMKHWSTVQQHWVANEGAWYETKDRTRNV